MVNLTNAPILFISPKLSNNLHPCVLVTSIRYLLLGTTNGRFVADVEDGKTKLILLS